MSDRILEISTEPRALEPTTREPEDARAEPGPAKEPGPGGPSYAVPPMPPPPGPRPQLPPPQPGGWERSTQDGAGGRILAWAGGIATLAGVVLLLVLAVQHGYLGPLPRVLLGAGLGGTLAGIGMWLHRNLQARTGAYALAATGFAVLYLDIVAATSQFGFFSPTAGLGAGLAVAGLGLLLAMRWNARALAVFVVLGAAVAAPILTGGFVPLLLGFLLVLEVAATPAQLVRRWGGLCLAAGLPPILAALAAVATVYDTNPADAPLIAYLSLVAAAQVIVATASAPRLSDHPLPAALVLLAPAPAMVAASPLPRAGEIALPATIGALLVLVWAVGRRAGSARFAMAAGAAGSVALLQATVLAFDGPTLAIVLLAEALLLAPALTARTMTARPAAQRRQRCRTREVSSTGSQARRNSSASALVNRPAKTPMKHPGPGRP